MLCENCKKNEANVKYTQIVNGVKKEMHLCEECSKKFGIGKMEFNMPISFSSFFGDFLNEYNSDFMPLLEKNEPIKCSKCNMTYDEFMNTGKFGCSSCYETFSENIDPILKRLHGGNRYLGRKVVKPKLQAKIKENKKDVKLDEETAKQAKLKELKAKIKQMITQENYEEAAKIRDEIKKIEEGK